MGKIRDLDRIRVRTGCIQCHRPVDFNVFLSYSLYTKDAEFRAWLVEERMINPETITKDQTKKEFARFMEDFNTGLYSHPSPTYF